MIGRRGARSSPPLWFALLVCVVVALAYRAIGSPAFGPEGVSLAFWGWIAALIGWVWEGVQAVGYVSLQVLNYIVFALEVTVRVMHNTLIFLGSRLAAGFRGAWKLLRSLYTDVLSPAWKKFFDWLDSLHAMLERVFKPILDVLARVRTALLKWYDTFVRPVLDTIGIARKILNVLGRLGLDWARRLDAHLADAQSWISDKFGELLGYVNALGNLINRVITLDGLIQRLALLRSIERDIVYVRRAFVNAFSRPITAADTEAMRRKLNERTIARVAPDVQEFLTTGGGYYGPVVRELAAQWRIYLRA